MIKLPEKWSILIPCYNGGEAARKFLQEVENTVDSARVLLVNDGSEEGFTRFLKSLDLPCLHLEENVGKGGALCVGLEYLRAKKSDFVVSLDCDGQHPLSELPKFIQIPDWRQVGIALGARPFVWGKMPPARIFSNRVSSKLVSWVAGFDILDAQCGYRVYHLALLKKDFLPIASRFQWESEVLIESVRNHLAIFHVPIPAIYGEETSHISHLKDTWRFLKMLMRKRKEK